MNSENMLPHVAEASAPVQHFVDKLGDHISSYIDKLKQDEIIHELGSRGIPIDKIAHKAVQQRVLRALLVGEWWGVKQNNAFTWNLLSKNIDVIQFYCEVPMFYHNSKIYFCGPYIESPRSKAIMVVVFFDLKTKKWETVNCTGKQVNPLPALKNFPIFGVYLNCFYMAYVSFESKQFTLDVFDMNTGEWNEMLITGYSIPSSLKNLRLDGVVVGEFMYVISADYGPLLVHKINLTNGACEYIICSGIIPECSNGGCSLFYNNSVILFSGDGTELHLLDIHTKIWTRKKISNPLQEFNTTRLGHIAKIYGDNIILIRAADGFKFNYMSLKDMTWKEFDTQGKRPNKVRSEASFLIHEDRLYVLGGQVSKNIHLLFLDLKKNQQQRELHQDLSTPNSFEMPQQTFYSKMYQDGHEDLVIEFPGTQDVLVCHRTVLAAHSEVFQKMLTNGMTESREQILPNLCYSSRLKIVDVEYNVFKQVLLYFYDLIDLEKLQEENQVDFGALFQAAGRYLLLPLQNKIADLLFGQISEEFAIPFFRLINGALPSIKEKYQDRVLKYISIKISVVSRFGVFDELCREEPNLIRMIFERKDEQRENQMHVRKKQKIYHITEPSGITSDLYLEPALK